MEIFNPYRFKISLNRSPINISFPAENYTIMKEKQQGKHSNVAYLGVSSEIRLSERSGKIILRDEKEPFGASHSQWKMQGEDTDICHTQIYTTFYISQA